MSPNVADKRAAIMNAALRLFTRLGFHGAPTSKIARAAGIGTGTLFHYFSTKEELISQLYLEVKEDLKTAMVEGVGEEDTVRAKIRRLWFNALQWGLNNPDRFMFFAQFRNSPFITTLCKEEAKAHLQFMNAILEEGRKQEVLKNLPPELAADIASGMLLGVTHHLMEHPEKLGDEGYLEQVFDMFWDSIRR